MTFEELLRHVKAGHGDDVTITFSETPGLPFVAAWEIGDELGAMSITREQMASAHDVALSSVTPTSRRATDLSQ